MTLADTATNGTNGAAADEWTPSPVSRPAPPRRRGVGERLSLGHVVMITAGLLAFVLVMAALSDRSATVLVATASREILPGTTVTADMVTEIELAADSPLIGAVASLDQIRVGAVTAGQRIGAGEPITLSALAPVSAPSGLRAMSVPVGEEFAVGGDLGAGDRIDVISVTGATATYIATDLEVLSTRQSPSRTGALSAGSLSGFFVVVAVDDQTALRLALAIDNGAMSVLRSTGAVQVDQTRLSLGSDSPTPGDLNLAPVAGTAGGDDGG